MKKTKALIVKTPNGIGGMTASAYSVLPGKVVCLSITLVLGACGPDLASGGENLDDEANEDCPELVGVGDTLNVLRITSLAQAESLPPYTRIDGGLRVEEVSGLRNLEFLSCLEEIRGGVAIHRNPDLESLKGLERLARLKPPSISSSSFWIWENPKLRNLDGLSGLEETFKLGITDNPMLESTAGLSSLRHADEILIQHNHSLVTVDLPSLESVGLLEIGTWDCPFWDPQFEPPPTPSPDGNASLRHLDGLSSLKTYEWLKIVGNPVLESIEGLASSSGTAFADIQLNPMLPYAQVLELDGSGALLDACGNLEDPTPCECWWGEAP